MNKNSRLTKWQLPAFYDPLEKVEPVGSFEHEDPGHRANPTFPSLLKNASKVVELSPHCGTELQGVQIVCTVPTSSCYS